MSSLKKDIVERKERKILRRAAVRQLTGLSDSTIWRYEAQDKFPHRVVLSDSGLVGWYSDEVTAWVWERVRAGGKRPAHIAPAATAIVIVAVAMSAAGLFA
jgi:predicted DNA-binding transcriptional regulator AlpA